MEGVLSLEFPSRVHWALQHTRPEAQYFAFKVWQLPLTSVSLTTEHIIVSAVLQSSPRVICISLKMVNWLNVVPSSCPNRHAISSTENATLPCHVTFNSLPQSHILCLRRRVKRGVVLQVGSASKPITIFQAKHSQLRCSQSTQISTLH